jgi:ATP-binding cassette subfamily B protein
VVALVTVPLSVFVAAKIGKRAQPQFISQWSVTGKLNGHIEEMYTGHSLVKVFGRQDESAEVFATHNDKLYGAAFRAQFVSGLIQPAMTFIGNINYVMCGIGTGGVRDPVDGVQAFIQYSRQFSQPITQVASMANLLQSGVASAARVQLLDALEQVRPPRRPCRSIRGAVSFENVRLVRPRPSAHRRPVVVGGAGPDRRDRRPDRQPQDHLQPGHAVLRGHRRSDRAGRRDRRHVRDELREAMGMVLQDTWLFGGTSRTTSPTARTTDP